jgi:hypothetical protein
MVNFLGLPLLLACSSGPLVAPSVSNENWNLYYKSIVQASGNALPSHRLLTAQNRKKVRVAAWTSIKLEKGEVNTIEEELTVTLIPEAQDFCRKIKKEELEERLRQRFGMPPLSEPYPSGEELQPTPTHFAILEVAPEDLFRPCRDPDLQKAGCGSEWPPEVSEEHRSWFEKKRKASHRIPDGEPFTMRGYSYDWSAESKNGKGFTILILKADASAKLITSLKTENYCWR